MRHQSEYPSAGLLIGVALLCALVLALNFALDLKDREVYRLYFDALDSCEGLACLAISDDLRSPVFLGLLIGSHKLGVGLDTLFAAISIFSVATIARSLNARADDAAALRFLHITLFLGVWLYLIQVKLCLAVALYLASRTTPRASLRVALMVLAILVHESILFLMLLAIVWCPPALNRRNIRLALPIVLTVLLAAAALHSLGVVETAWQRVEHYRDLVSAGDVPSISRTGGVSVLLLCIAVAGLLLHLFGEFPLKVAAWMALPWLTFMALAGNEVFALRLSALTLLHLLLVVPLSRRPAAADRALLSLIGIAFGTLVFIKDIALA
jgi:hypothetical protein